MTTGRINQVTTAHGRSARRSRPPLGPPAATWRTAGPALYTNTQHFLAPFANPQTQHPAGTARTGHALHGWRGQRQQASTEHATERTPLRAIVQPRSRPCEAPTVGRQPHLCGATTRPDRHGHCGSATLWRRDVQDGLAGSPAAPRLDKRHRRVRIGANQP